jgi:flagellar M-ring protein FliF
VPEGKNDGRHDGRNDAKNGVAQVAIQLKQLWERQPKRRKTLAILVVLGIFAIVVIPSIVKHTETWTVVVEGSSPDDAQELLATLQGRGVAARLHEGKVEVPSERIDEARAIASSAGLPHTGKGFELFDGSSLGQSSFAEQVNYRRALQGELARSITALAQVQGARVHLALGRRSVFKDQDEPASASVALHLHPGQALTSEQVRGVRQMVAASVEGMKAENVVVVDNHGNLLDAADPGNSDKRAEIERTLTARVRTMLERVVGSGKVSVVTTAVVDERKLSETQEVYDQDHPATRSETRTIEGEGATQGVGGVAGARGNLPGAPAAAPTPGNPANGRVQETKNYELSRTVRQMTRPDAQLQKLYLAVVVDYKTGADGKPVPRSDKELAELTALARQAAGIDEARGDRIELRTIPFAPDAETATAAAAPATGELPIVPIAIGAGGALVVLVVLGMLLKRRRHARKPNTQLAFPTPIAELERVLEARPSIDLAAVAADAQPGLPPGKPVRDRVLEAVRGDVDRAAEVLTAWLSEAPPAKGATK